MIAATCFILVALLSSTSAFRPSSTSKIMNSKQSLKMSFNPLTFPLLLCDTSVSEEEVLAVSGQVVDLPDPLFAVGFAFLVFAGVAALQFSLGDLNKQEGQARYINFIHHIGIQVHLSPYRYRVRDFLQTRRDTERKRGYFD
jgi:hypothetical protein